MNAEAVRFACFTVSHPKCVSCNVSSKESSALFPSITGVPPGQADAQSTYTALPEGKTYDDKFVFGICLGSGMVGCADLIRGFPTATTALLRLLLVSEARQHRGVGRRAYALIEQFVRTWQTCDCVRIGIVRTNEEVIPFWSKLGFKPSGEVRPYKYGAVSSETVMLERRLPPTRPVIAALI